MEVDCLQPCSATFALLRYPELRASHSAGHIHYMATFISGGFSLGAFLSLALATQDSRIAAVAELFGGLPEQFTKDAGNLPPVLILHGAQDTTVPVERAHELERILQQHKIPYRIKIYPDQGHVFRGLGQLDAMRLVAQFFRTYLVKAA